MKSVLGADQADSQINVGAGSFDSATGQVEFQGQEDAEVKAVFLDLSGATGRQSIQLPENMQQASTVVIDSDVGVDLEFNTVERVIVTGRGDDEITVNGDANTTVESAGGGDTITTSGGDDSIIGGSGDDSLSSGEGNDTIVTGRGDDTIDAGEGYDKVQIRGDSSDFDVEVVDGALVVDDGNGNVATIENAEFISFADGETLTVSGSESTATVMRLYEGLLGRSAEFEGAQYWAEVANSGAASLSEIAQYFLSSEEFAANNPDPMTDEEFVTMLYQNVHGRAPEAETGLDYWVDVLEQGYGRNDVAIWIIGSEEAVDVNDATVKFIDGWV
ncbi:hypothetical protein M911_06795 [Ectothiorhodospira haloalkaliphila]|uniref:DUF4214 domain-containing protein n=1 Tax=Ectothiorhodospira haloalkaliphila TaxID=421628 RepID=W8KLL5_9GAMM|nr:hypothetical protein M911_06795 [Ectothiorhodospira haloalkaliphila]